MAEPTDFKMTRICWNVQSVKDINLCADASTNTSLHMPPEVWQHLEENICETEKDAQTSDYAAMKLWMNSSTTMLIQPSSMLIFIWAFMFHGGLPGRKSPHPSFRQKATINNGTNIDNNGSNIHLITKTNQVSKSYVHLFATLQNGMR